MCATGEETPGSHEDRSFQWLHREQLLGQARLSGSSQLQLQGCSFQCTSPQQGPQPEASLLARHRSRSCSIVGGRLAPELGGWAGRAGAQPGAPAASQGPEHGAHVSRPLQQPSPRLLQALSRCECIASLLAWQPDAQYLSTYTVIAAAVLPCREAENRLQTGSCLYTHTDTMAEV